MNRAARRIGVVGAGALGTYFAAMLAATHEVVVLARRPEVAAAIERDGIFVSDGAREHHVAVRATVDPAALGRCEIVLCAVKAYATAAALAPLRDVLPAGALVTSVQNGIDFVDDARAVLPRAQIVAGSTTQGATLTATARVRASNRGTTVFGDAELARAWSAAGLETRVDADMTTVLWKKLVINAAINAPCALALQPNGAVIEDPDLMTVARALANEAAAAAHHAGVAIADAWALVEAAARATAANRNSMLQDLDAGRRTEIDSIAGAVVRTAAQYRSDATLNAAMVNLVHARERTGR